MLVEPTEGRAAIYDEGGKIKIVIPAKINLFALLFLLCWMGGWGFGEISVCGEVFSGSSPDGATAFMIFWLGAWTWGGLAVMFYILWMCFGVETIQADAAYLSYERTIAYLGPSREYRMQDIRNLRVNPSMGYYGSYRTYYRPSIAFDYGARTCRMGYAVDDAEAALIVRKLQERFALKS